MFSLKAFENKTFGDYAGVSKVLTDIILLKRGLKEVIQFPLNEFAPLEYENLKKFCIGNRLNADVVADSRSGENKVIIFNKKSSAFYKERLALPGDKIRGELFGYPQCCIENLKNIDDKSYLFSHKNIKPLVRANIEEFSFENNFLLFDSCFHLFSHLPCSKDCKNTAKISKEVLAGLKEFDDRIYRNYLAVNRLSILLFGDSGIRIFLNGRFEGDKVAYTKLLWTHKMMNTHKLDETEFVEILNMLLNRNEIEISQIIGQKEVSLVKVK